jgi:Family of unknown function (DUF5682)
LPFDTEPFEAALVRLEEQELPPEIAGAVMAFAVLDGRADGAALDHRLRGELAAAYTNAAQRMAFLSGIIAIARELLWTFPQIVATLDALLGELDEDGFIAMLPYLRLTLMPLDPNEVDRLSSIVAERLGVGGDSLARVVAISEDELIANTAMDRDMARILESEGIGGGVG